uniref:Uncharacterized protein n=1 Tax=Vespula pensylvanica TaxID=30213 RepID=A0A834NQF4_VESPE|nr:hypothetical protein H0235_012214 [Vespula pensylvanica]
MVKKVYNDLNVVRLSEGNPRSANSLNVLAIQVRGFRELYYLRGIATRGFLETGRSRHIQRALPTRTLEISRVHYRGKTQDRAWLNGCSAMSQEKIVPNDYPCKTAIDNSRLGICRSIDRTIDSYDQ